jgi:hypothetical protein
MWCSHEMGTYFNLFFVFTVLLKLILCHWIRNYSILQISMIMDITYHIYSIFTPLSILEKKYILLIIYWIKNLKIYTIFIIYNVNISVSIIYYICGSRFFSVYWTKKKFQRKTNVKEINSRYEFVIGSIDNLNNII